MKPEESKRKRFLLLKNQLDNERSTFIPHWRDLSDYILPRRSRFFISDVNKGDRRNQKIIDSTATMSASTLSSGMMSGVTSPARPWFRLAAPDPDMNEIGSVKQWLYTVSQRMSDVFLKTNLYNILPTAYADLGTFGTAPISVEEDFHKVMRFQSFPVGSYRIAKDPSSVVNVFLREYRMTVRQLIEEFGNRDSKGNIDWSNFSIYVKTQYDRGMYEGWIDVCHVIAPNEDYNYGSPFSKEKRFASCYFELGTQTGSEGNYMNGSDGDRFLREAGFDYFPVLCPRWSVTGEDVYGTDCPGMRALGDIKQLQAGEKRIAQAIEKMVNPPMIADISMANSKSSILPGDITYANLRDGQVGFRPAHTVDPKINELEGKQEQIRKRIDRAYYADLFLMLSQSDRREITAREIDERHEEKLLALGPVLEQLNQDLLNPLIDIAFEIMLRQGLIPPAPPQLQGAPLKVEYISVMAQAQKMIGIESQERFMSNILAMLPEVPSIADKIDFDQAIENYGDNLSIAPGIVRTDEVVAALRQQKAQAQAIQQHAEVMQQSAQAAKNLSQADLSGDNALTRVMNQTQAGQVVPQT